MQFYANECNEGRDAPNKCHSTLTRQLGGMPLFICIPSESSMIFRQDLKLLFAVKLGYVIKDKMEVSLVQNDNLEELKQYLEQTVRFLSSYSFIVDSYVAVSCFDWSVMLGALSRIRKYTMLKSLHFYPYPSPKGKEKLIRGVPILPSSGKIEGVASFCDSKEVRIQRESTRNKSKGVQQQNRTATECDIPRGLKPQNHKGFEYPRGNTLK